ncbi:four helix bundle protein [Empedobacter stercoris]|uniref:Four helix bundle protein n=1 Tax=Empedobacter falsenii TaxID=343874 RepID=A0ABY8V4P1_9FLAO|nr:MULTISPECIES: four helix bundle protein [Empedobacter]MDM1522626.1 four helix bundle protein [Empedobacter sp. 225-1]MDM1543820.1 four helix bundle protein [Empedobacter sp. 189-2]UWX66448.1 four helix bundle protein [Empedobacter stercoris]WIH96629.1 four helix bundle protein [Empedobacter falsenii]
MGLVYDLNLWKEAHQLVLEVYKTVDKFPKSEIFALSSQMKRCAVSVPANIVEGYKKQTKAHQIHFYNISDTSLEELKYYFLLSRDLKYITEKEYKILISKSEEVGKMITGYIKHIKSK